MTWYEILIIIAACLIVIGVIVASVVRKSRARRAAAAIAAAVRAVRAVPPADLRRRKGKNTISTHNNLHKSSEKGSRQRLLFSVIKSKNEWRRLNIGMNGMYAICRHTAVQA